MPLMGFCADCVSLNNLSQIKENAYLGVYLGTILDKLLLKLNKV